MNIYLVDDDQLVVRGQTKRWKHEVLLPRLLSILKKKKSLPWRDGFRGRGPEAWKNGSLLADAVNDPNGVLLIDISMPGADSKSIIKTLGKKIGGAAWKSVVEKTNDSAIAFLAKDKDTKVGVHLTACAVALGRPFVFVTILGDEGRQLQEYFAVGGWPFPSIATVGNEPFIKARLNRIADDILNVIDPYDHADLIWKDLKDRVVKAGWFGSRDYWHNAKDWILYADTEQKRRLTHHVEPSFKSLLNVPNLASDFAAVIRTLKGIDYIGGCLPLPIIEYAINRRDNRQEPLGAYQELGYNGDHAWRFPCLASNGGPGRTLKAIRLLYSEKPPNSGCSVLRDPNDHGRILIQFSSRFPDQQSAKIWAGEFRQSSDERRSQRAKEKKNGLGRAFSACDDLCQWLNLNKKDVVQVDSSEVRLRFSFAIGAEPE